MKSKWSTINQIRLVTIAVCCLLLLAGCKSGTGQAPKTVHQIPDEWDGKITTRGNKSPYVVFGKTYEVLPDSLGYREIGIASWYGKKFHGRLTSNGERFDMYRLSAAHKALPLPTVVKVTNLDNGRHVIVRVNDRGPFHDERIIDLSYEAALRLGFSDSGTTPVVVEALDGVNYPELADNP